MFVYPLIVVVLSTSNVVDICYYPVTSNSFESDESDYVFIPTFLFYVSTKKTVLETSFLTFN